MAGLSGKSLGGFRILEQIDEESGQGIVCKAVCETENPDVAVRAGQVVALKVMPVRDDGRQQWRRLESRTKELARIDHPNVVRYYGCFCEQGEWNQLHVIVQEFLEGETLRDRLKRFPSGLDVDEGLKIASLALEGLEHTASKGIVHRDIKPGNIFICGGAADGGPSVKLIDFEIARQGQGSTTASTGNLRGSFNYMAPEFLDARFRGDLLSDVFSMGVTLHETLTGKLPYDHIEGNGDDAILDFVARWKGVSDGKSPVSVSQDLNRLLAHTDRVFAGCLSPERGRRFRGFGEFREALRSVRFRSLSNPASGSAYQMLQFVGKGGFGEVFKARESKTGLVVAIKHLRKSKYADRFKREAKVLSRFDDDCFVRFVESFSRDMDGRPQEFLVMGFLDGMPGNSLWDAIRKSGGAGLPKEDVFAAFVRYARGLRMLHSAGVFHRDIKPSNLYFPSGRPELAAIMDLGIARDTKGTMTVGSVPGTPDYMPPEVVTAGSRGESGWDIYSLGLCMYEALTAKPAFARLPSDIDGLRKLVERVNDRVLPRFDDARIDADVLELLSDMTAFDPERRIRDVRDVERRLRGILARLGRDPGPAPAPAPRPALRPAPGRVPVPDGRNGIPWKRVFRFAAIAGTGAVVCGALALAFPAAKRSYAEKRLAGVLDSYRRADPDAVGRENAWIIEFNPRSNGWLRLDEATFARCTNEINAAKGEARRMEWQDRIGRSLLRDGGLAVGAFGGLDRQVLPSELEDDDRIRAKLSELGRAVRIELGRCLAIGDIKSRRGRLKAADGILANHWTVKVLDADEMRSMRKAIDGAMAMCVGSVHNGCGGEIEVCGVKIGVGESKTVVVEDGRPERHLVERQGYRPVPLPTGFDGMDFNVYDSTFSVRPVRFAIPKLADGLRFSLRDREYAGGESVELEPGRYIGKYVRGDKTRSGERIYKDYFVEFSVTSSADVEIPKPGNWEYTDEYREFLAAPVDVALPRLEDGVRCAIDGVAARHGMAKVAPGDHLCVYEKDDCVAQTNSFEVAPGKSLALSAPLAWKPTVDVERLRAAAGLAEQNRWAEVEKAIRGVSVVSIGNVEELVRLERGVAVWNEAEAKRLAAEKKSLGERIARLLSVEPVADRRKRLSDARKLLADGETRRILGEDEAESLLADVRAAAELVAGRIRNGCDFAFSVDGVAIAPGESRLVRYDGGRSQGVVVSARGYEDIAVGMELDGAEIAVANGRWTASDVPVRLGAMLDGVECLFNGERVKGDFKVRPGRYSLLFKRNGYEPQFVDFTARIAEGCTVEAPRMWNPLPVEISLPALEDGVRCFLDGREVSGSVRLAPGRFYEFQYRKDDCEDQSVNVLVEAGSPAVVPAPSLWVDAPDVRKLAEAEKYLAGGSLDEASKLLDGIRLRAPANVRRLRALEDEIGKASAAREERRRKEERIREFLERAEQAYAPEALLGGDARDCIEAYCGAVENGHAVGEGDIARIEHCYKVGLDDLEAQRRSVDIQIRKGVRPFRDPAAIDRDIKQLKEWHGALRKAYERTCRS